MCVTSHLPRRRRERRGLQLWPVGTVLALTFVTAVSVAAAVFFAGWDLLGAHGLKTERRLTSKTLFDLVKLSFGVVAGAGALVALIVAYRRQRVDEDGALRDATRLHTERFSTAVSQLGAESAAVRLGGVHALAGLADDAPTRGIRQTCIDVLCAYLRLPYTAEADLPSGDADARHAYLALREVRHTVIRLIRDHLRHSPGHPHSWHGHDLDFTDVVFDGGDFSDTTFTGGTVSFNGATFADHAVSFNGATFIGGTVSFESAHYPRGMLLLRSAQFAGSTVVFSDAELTGGGIDFTGATFTAGTVSFISAAVLTGTVAFMDAKFSGSTVDFNRAEFSGGTVFFSQASFTSGAVSFRDAGFVGGTVHFNHAEFTGDTVDFSGAEFIDGSVDFSDAHGDAAPRGLAPSVGAFPAPVSVPQAWRSPPG